MTKSKPKYSPKAIQFAKVEDVPEKDRATVQAAISKRERRALKLK